VQQTERSSGTRGVVLTSTRDTSCEARADACADEQDGHEPPGSPDVSGAAGRDGSPVSAVSTAPYPNHPRRRAARPTGANSVRTELPRARARYAFSFRKRGNGGQPRRRRTPARPPTPAPRARLRLGDHPLRQLTTWPTHGPFWAYLGRTPLSL